MLPARAPPLRFRRGVSTHHHNHATGRAQALTPGGPAATPPGGPAATPPGGQTLGQDPNPAVAMELDPTLDPAVAHAHEGGLNQGGIGAGPSPMLAHRGHLQPLHGPQGQQEEGGAMGGGLDGCAGGWLEGGGGRGTREGLWEGLHYPGPTLVPTLSWPWSHFPGSGHNFLALVTLSWP